MEIRGTQSKKLIAYIDRVISYLDLHDVPGLIDIDILRECANGAGGYCHGDENHIQIEVARYDHNGKVPTALLMQNIAHEMIHADQICRGRLVNHGFVLNPDKSDAEVGLSYKWEWEGQEYIDIPYDDHPWEHEAYSLEETVYAACK